MPRCHIPSCLGHADERPAEVACTRCQGRRWVLVSQASPDPTGYTCIRCRAALAGRSVIDPAGKPRSGDTTNAPDPHFSPANAQRKVETREATS
jgi:DNA-directed RNA polymerase subunit RPC12/RpoP